MSKFYGSLEGEKKPKTKIGQRRIEAHIRSWDHGIRVLYGLDGSENTICYVYETGGSNNPQKLKLIKKYKLGKTSNRKPGWEGRGGIGN